VIGKPFFRKTQPFGTGVVPLLIEVRESNRTNIGRTNLGNDIL